VDICKREREKYRGVGVVGTVKGRRRRKKKEERRKEKGRRMEKQS